MSRACRERTSACVSASNERSVQGGRAGGPAPQVDPVGGETDTRLGRSHTFWIVDGRVRQLESDITAVTRVRDS